MIDEVAVSGSTVVLYGNKEYRSNLCIEYVDYGDNYFDLQIIHKETGNLFGGAVLSAIPTKACLEQKIEELKEKTGITEVRKYEAW